MLNIRTLSAFERAVLGTLTAGVLVVLAILVVLSRQYVGTRLIAPAGSRLRVKTGEAQTVTYKTSSRAPSVKIDLCAEKLPLTNCVSLAKKAGGRETKVHIPSDYPLGKALLVVRERRANGALTGTTQFRRPLLVVQGAPPLPSLKPVARVPDGGTVPPLVSRIRVRADSHGPGSGTYTLMINFETSQPVCEEVVAQVEANGQPRAANHHYSEQAGPPHCSGTEPHQGHSTWGLTGIPDYSFAGQNMELRFVYRPGRSVSGIWIPTADAVVIAGPFQFQMPTDDQDRTWEF